MRLSARDDRGTATAEMAVVLPALVAVLMFALWSIVVVTGQLRCVDAAREAARAIARGDTAASSLAVARAAAPDGAQVLVSRSAGLVVVEVRSTARLPGPWGGSLPSLSVSGRAVTAAESGIPAGDLTDGDVTDGDVTDGDVTDERLP